MKVSKLGDGGQTGLLGPGRVSKTDLRLEAYGTVDELSAALGLARAAASDPRARAIIHEIQVDLMTVGAEQATPGEVYGKSPFKVTPEHVAKLDRWIEELSESVEIGNQFVQPGQTLAEAALHLARTIARRAERRTVALAEAGLSSNPDLVRYLNRLSSVLFILARYEERDPGPNGARPSAEAGGTA